MGFYPTISAHSESSLIFQHCPAYDIFLINTKHIAGIRISLSYSLLKATVSQPMAKKIIDSKPSPKLISTKDQNNYLFTLRKWQAQELYGHYALHKTNKEKLA